MQFSHYDTAVSSAERNINGLQRAVPPLNPACRIPASASPPSLVWSCAAIPSIPFYCLRMSLVRDNNTPIHIHLPIPPRFNRKAPRLFLAQQLERDLTL